MGQEFKFIDLFAGIGGFRIAFEAQGGECVFSSEYDRYAQKTYEAFFRERPDFSEIKKVDPPGDITKIEPSEIPQHNILAAGFPCQPFSLAGVSKKQSLGRPHGFNDPTQGTLFFNVKEIIKAKKPEAFVLENVKNLRSHDGGRTFATIMDTLENELGYTVFTEVIDASHWVPQGRQRVFLVGFRTRQVSKGQKWKVEDFDFSKLSCPEHPISLSEILEESVSPKYTLGPGTWKTLERHKLHHENKGQGFGYGLISPPFGGKKTRTLSARYHKDGAEILIDQGNGQRPRRLTPLECCRLMGYPKECQDFFDLKVNHTTQPVSDTQAYRQFGNSVVVPVVTSIAELMVKELKRAGAFEPTALRRKTAARAA